MRPLRLLALAVFAVALLAGAEGDDLTAAFARARPTGSLRLAAIGGSITQAGQGWIGPWLRQRLPGVVLGQRLAGMSATGSELGCFRLDRDVIAAEPDLVLVETAVNDSGLSDPETVRCLETLVRRLVLLPRRPGVLLVLAAARGGANHQRHHAVATHYGLRCVDLQAAVNTRLAAGARWEDFFTDDVHPNDAGHALYAEALAKALEPSVDGSAAAQPVPAPLSPLPLWLDGRMWVPGTAPGWTAEPQVAGWHDCFFLGVVAGRDPAQPLVVPVRGTTVGALFALEADTGGTVLASVDGGQPIEFPCHLRGGYDWVVLARDLPPGEHRLTLVPATYKPGPVRLGYILAAGVGADAVPPQGPWTPQRLAGLRLEPVPGNAFRIAGPVGDFVAGAGDPAAVLAAPPLPQRAAAYRGDSVPGPAGPVPVRRGPGASPVLVFADAAPWRGTAVAVARFRAERDDTVLLGLAADYYARLRLNGAEVIALTSAHGSSRLHQLAVVRVHAGWNELTVTVLPGSKGFTCDLLLERPAGGPVAWETE